MALASLMRLEPISSSRIAFSNLILHSAVCDLCLRSFAAALQLGHPGVYPKLIKSFLTMLNVLGIGLPSLSFWSIPSAFPCGVTGNGGLMCTSSVSESLYCFQGNLLIHCCSCPFHLSDPSLRLIDLTLMRPFSAATTFSPDPSFMPRSTPDTHRASALPMSRCYNGWQNTLSPNSTSSGCMRRPRNLWYGTLPSLRTSHKVIIVDACVTIHANTGLVGLIFTPSLASSADLNVLI